MIVKSRKQGNSLMITIPSYLNVPEGIEYEVKASANGELIFSPVEKSKRESATNEDISAITDDIFKGYDAVFKELVDK